jgi:hypothetical protein
MIAHIAQPVQPQLSVWAGKKPLLLDVPEIAMICFGQILTHKPQPLHLSVLIIILPDILVLHTPQIEAAQPI